MKAGKRDRRLRNNELRLPIDHKSSCRSQSMQLTTLFQIILPERQPAFPGTNQKYTLFHVSVISDLFAVVANRTQEVCVRPPRFFPSCSCKCQSCFTTSNEPHCHCLQFYSRSILSILLFLSQTRNKKRIERKKKKLQASP